MDQELRAVTYFLPEAKPLQRGGGGGGSRGSYFKYFLKNAEKMHVVRVERVFHLRVLAATNGKDAETKTPLPSSLYLCVCVFILA